MAIIDFLFLSCVVVQFVLRSSGHRMVILIRFGLDVILIGDVERGV